MTVMPKPEFGFCPVCGEARKLTRDGSVRRHTGNKRGLWPPQDCDGTGRLGLAEPSKTTEEA